MNFWQKLPYVKRNSYLLLFALLFTVLVWKLSLSATYDLYQQITALEAQAEQAQSAPEAIKKMQQQAAQWEQAALAYTATQADVQKLLLANVSAACASNKVVLKELIHAGGADESGARIETFRVQLEGGFHALLKATQQLEQELKGGRLVSVQFQRIHDKRNNRTFLQVTLYLQSILKEEAYAKN